MADELRRVGEQLPTARMIVVGVAVDDPAHGHVEALVELALEPRRCLLARRIDDDDALRCHEEHAEMPHVAEAIEIAGDVVDLVARQAFAGAEALLRLGDRVGLTARGERQ